MTFGNVCNADAGSPIGVFDSGVGGLTVVKEIMHQMPNEKIVYFGDTARVPYGSKSKDTVTRFSRQIVRFLEFRLKFLEPDPANDAGCGVLTCTLDSSFLSIIYYISSFLSTLFV